MSGVFEYILKALGVWPVTGLEGPFRDLPGSFLGSAGGSLSKAPKLKRLCGSKPANGVIRK
jgi:hypothetical protein